MKKADPRVKLLWTILCTGGALLFTQTAWMAGLCLFTLAGAWLLGANIPAFAQRLKRLLPLLLMITAVQILFARSGRTLAAVGDFTLMTWDGVERGLNTALRLTIILGTAAVMAEENNRRVIAAITKLGVPYLFSFLLLTALRFIPFFKNACKDALTAVQLRGVQPEKLALRKKMHLYRELVLPVLTDAVVRSRELAVAMEARGFGAMPERTTFFEIAMTPLDRLLILALLVIAGASLGFYYLL